MRIALLFLVALLAAALTSFAWCYQCSVYQDCFGTSYNGSANCYSYGNSCMVSGTCVGIDVDPYCTTNCPKIPKIQQESSVRPLNLEYQLAEVRIERPAVASVKSARN